MLLYRVVVKDIIKVCKQSESANLPRLFPLQPYSTLVLSPIVVALARMYFSE